MQILFKSWSLWHSCRFFNAEKQSKSYFYAYSVPGSFLQRLYYRFNLYAVICRNKLILATQNHLTTFINGTYRAFPVSSRCLREDPAELLLSDLLELVERFVVVLREDDVMAALSSFSMSSISLSFKSVDAGLFFTDSELTFPKSSKFKHPAPLHRV